MDVIYFDMSTPEEVTALIKGMLDCDTSTRLNINQIIELLHMMTGLFESESVTSSSDVASLSSWSSWSDSSV